MSKMLDKVSKLLAKAENAGTPEEAEAFMAKAMEMASINAIDLAVARAHQVKKEKIQEVEERRIAVNPRNRRHNRKHFVDLGLAIADVNDVKCLIGGGEYILIGTGFPEDLDVIEALFTHLSVQMVTECDEALKKGENKRVTQVRKTTRQPIAWEDRDWGGWSGRTYYDENPDDDAYCYQRNGESDVDYEKRLEEEIVKVRKEYEEAVANGTSSYSGATDRYRKPVPPPAFLEIDVLDDNGDFIYEEKEVSAVDGRVFRHEFYSAFVSRMRGRLWEIKKSAEREAGALVESSSTALALRDKKKEVGDAFEKRLKVGHVGTYTGAGEQGRGYDHTGKGREAGRKAADTVPVNEGRAVRPT